MNSESQAHAAADEILTEDQAAAYLRVVSTSTLQKSRLTGPSRQKGTLVGPPFLKVGRRVYYRRNDLDNWLAAQARHAA